jgi:hypothetical protein
MEEDKKVGARSDGSASISGTDMQQPFDIQKIDARWRRRNALGTACSVVWLLSMVAVVVAGCITHAGPFGWLAQGQLALLGSENPVLEAIPLYLLLLGLPYMVVRKLPRRLDRPFLCGIQESIDPRREPVVRPLPGAVRQRLVRLRNGALVACALLLGGGAASFWICSHSGEPAGRPLLQLTVEAVSSTTAALPPFARIVGAEAHRDRAWIWNHSVRQTRYRDYYIPLTAAGWQVGDPVTLVELDTLLPDDAPTDSNALEPAESREGAISRDAPGAWVIGEMRRQGLQVVDHPVLLERRHLRGVTPGPDMISAWLFLGMGTMLALFAALIAWSANRRARMFVVDKPPQHGGGASAHK